MASPALMPVQDILDPQRKAQYSIHISQDLLDGRNKDPCFASVRVNHKPSKRPGATRTIRLRSSLVESQPSRLDIKDRVESGNSSIYRYEGTKSSPKQSFVIVFDQDDQTATLQPIGFSYSFNLIHEPGASSPTQLAEQYAQLYETSETVEDVAQDELVSSLFDDGADPDNPFDFRHFLYGAKSPHLSPSPGPTSLTPNPSSQYLGSSPARERAASNPEGRTSTSTSSSTTLQKPFDRPTPRIRVQRKATDDRSTSTTSSKGSKGLSRKSSKNLSTLNTAASSPPIPRSVNHTIESQEFDLLGHNDHAESPPNKASSIEIDDDDEDDDFMGINGPGGLEIDFGDEGPPPSRARAITLPGSSASASLRNGLGISNLARRPISLRSAANSPGSKAQTPRKRLQDILDESEGVHLADLGAGSSRPTSSRMMVRRISLMAEDEEAMQDADISSDEDEEPLLMAKQRNVATRDPAEQRQQNQDDNADEYDDDIEPMQLDALEADAENMDVDADADAAADVAQAEDGAAWDAGSPEDAYVHRVQESESESEAE